MEVSFGGIIGLYSGMILGLFAWWFGRKQARKNRGLDELYFHIWQKARSYSWYVTLGTLYVLFSLILFVIEISAAIVLSILIIAHLGSWSIIGGVLSINMSNPDLLEPSRVKLGIIIIAVSIIVFTIISILTNNWKFLLFSILPNLIGVLIALTPNKNNSE